MNLPEQRPNFVLLIGEDTGRYLGCYGDRSAISLNLDRLAADGARYTSAFSHSPVCSPSRGGIVTGRYPTAAGFHHHRSKLPDPPPLFTSYLREAGYHVSWPGKQDFNFTPPPGSFTDDADWSLQLPRQPFFVYANLFQTHESRMREPYELHLAQTARLTKAQRQDPAKVEVPPYLPDTPEVRQEIAWHYENVTTIDNQVADVLAQLDRAGVANNTIVIFLADHGRGLPREKRWLYDRGIHMPLILCGPGIKPGSVIDDLVGWVDIAPTILSLAGLPIADGLDGQAFLGPAKAPSRRYVFAARDRMDETTDRVRAVRSRRYKYIRNLMPHLSHAQPIAYMEQLATMQAMRAHHAAGRAYDVQAAFFAPTKPAEELYDSLADPWEIHDLAADPTLADVLTEHRRALDDWSQRFDTLGSIDEAELLRRGLLAPAPLK